MNATDTDFEVIELPTLDARIICDIGNHTNRGVAPCPNEAEWRLAYTCCMHSSLMCSEHKDAFLSVYFRGRPGPRRCPRCRTVAGPDVLLVEPL